MAALAEFDLIPPKVEAVSPTGVSLSDGSFTVHRTDILIGTLALERNYSGSYYAIIDSVHSDPNTLFNGVHWTNNFDIYVTPEWHKESNQDPYARPTVHLGTGASGMYSQSDFSSSATATLNEDNIDAQKGILRWVSGAYEYTEASGAVYHFNPNVLAAGTTYATKTYSSYAQRIASIVYPDGRVRSFSYVNGQLKVVSDSTGYAIVFDWGSNGFVAAACGFNLAQTYVSTTTTCDGAPLRVTYVYNVSGSDLLTDVTDVLQNNEHFGYDGNKLMNCVQPAGAPGCQISNLWSAGGVGGSLTQTLAGGPSGNATWSYSFSDWSGRNTEDHLTGDGLVETDVTDPVGHGWQYFFTGTSPWQFIDPIGHPTYYQFTGGRTAEQLFDPSTHFGSILQNVTQTEGNQYQVDFNGPYKSISKETWHPKSGPGSSDPSKTYVYTNWTGPAAQATKPNAIIDARGNQTDYTVATHGGILTEMQPAPFAGAPRPLKIYTYTLKNAYIKDSSGNLVQSGGQITMPNTETTCQTAPGSSYTACDSSAIRTDKTFEYGADGTANNLRVRGVLVASGGKARRTCFGYDNQGHKIWETKPRAGLGSCP